MNVLFYPVLGAHILTVCYKLAILFRVPKLENVSQIKEFLTKFKKKERMTDYVLWATGAGLFLVTSIKLLLNLWMLVSMLLYTLIFLMIKYVIIRRLELIVKSKKIYAPDEIKTLRFENTCVAVVIVGILGGIGYLMMTKPF
jgi:hypothetical protein